MSVRTLMACVPRCFRCLLEIPSGPVEEVFLEALMAAIVLSGVNCDGSWWSVGSECSIIWDQLVYNKAPSLMQVVLHITVMLL